MAIENGDLVHERFPKHTRMGTARMKYEDGKKRGVSVEKSKAARKK